MGRERGDCMTEAILYCECVDVQCHPSTVMFVDNGNERPDTERVKRCSMPIHQEDQGTSIRKCRRCMAYAVRKFIEGVPRYIL